MNREFVKDKAEKAHHLRYINRLGFPLSKVRPTSDVLSSLLKQKVTKEHVVIKSQNKRPITADWIVPKELVYPEKVIVYFHGGK